MRALLPGCSASRATRPLTGCAEESSLSSSLEDGQDLGIEDPAPTPDAALETVQRFHGLERALARALPTEHREILLLREIEEMSYENIAEVLDISLGTVKSRIARARAGLLEKIPR